MMILKLLSFFWLWKTLAFISNVDTYSMKKIQKKIVTLAAGSKGAAAHHPSSLPSTETVLSSLRWAMSANQCSNWARAGSATSNWPLKHYLPASLLPFPV